MRACVRACVYGFHGKYNYCGLVLQISRFISQCQSVSCFSDFQFLDLRTEGRSAGRFVKPQRCGIQRYPASPANLAGGIVSIVTETMTTHCQLSRLSNDSGIAVINCH